MDTKQIETENNETAPEKDLLSQGEKTMLDRISSSIKNKKKGKGLSARAYIAIIKKVMRANRSKYTPHVGKKQEAKQNKKQIKS